MKTKSCTPFPNDFFTVLLDPNPTRNNVKTPYSDTSAPERTWYNLIENLT